MTIGIIAAVVRSRSLEFDLTVIGIGCFVTAIIMATSLMMRRARTESWDDINPLKTDVRSNMMRAYRASAKSRMPLYWALGFGILGAILLVAAGILQVVR